jgi:hypothetical protein
MEPHRDPIAVSYNIIKQAIEQGQQKGAYSLKEAAIIFNALVELERKLLPAPSPSGTSGEKINK